MIRLIRWLAFDARYRNVTQIINSRDVVGRDVEVEGRRKLAET